MSSHDGESALPTRELHVVLFSGGRGSTALVRLLARHPSVSLTLAINGYDDGASTGEVRRFLGDSLGPSDFRKNASRLAMERACASLALIGLLDYRLPADATANDARGLCAALRDEAPVPSRLSSADVFVRGLETETRAAIAGRLRRFEDEMAATGRPFRFADCAVGNLVFAGSFLIHGRAFNAAVDDYCALLGLPAGAIENVTDGSNAYLVAIGADGQVLGSEEEIVDATRRNRISDIYLIGRPLSEADRELLTGAAPEDRARHLASLATAMPLNPRLGARLAEADFIIYAPGTQHSSLFPSYLTAGLSEVLAHNLTAIKLLITNIQSDAEIAGATAIEIIERAIYYLQGKGQGSIPAPCLITHYLLNEPGAAGADAPYVPLGRLDNLEDPRLFRIGSYEDGVTGRHDATRVLQPFLDSLAPRRKQVKVAVLLHHATSANKIAQSILEMVRFRVQELPLDVTVFYEFEAGLAPRFEASLPFAVRNLATASAGDADERLRTVLAEEDFDYVALFESSGMYRADDLVGLLAQLPHGRLDAIWGSRRLSVRDIEASYRLRYRHNAGIGALSFVGSHLLSLAYLLLYGRYVSDTLSAVRVVRCADACGVTVPLTHRQVNHHLLTGLLRRKAELLELPVRFFPLSPDRVRRTTIWEGLQAFAFILWRRLRVALRAPRPATLAAGSGDHRADPPVGS